MLFEKTKSLEMVVVRCAMTPNAHFLKTKSVKTVVLRCAMTPNAHYSAKSCVKRSFIVVP